MNIALLLLKIHFWNSLLKLISLGQFLFLGEISPLGDFFLISENERKTQNTCEFYGFFGPLFEIKIIKLVRCRPKHFLGHICSSIFGNRSNKFHSRLELSSQNTIYRT